MSLGERTLFLGPHNDDVELFSCFNLLRYRESAHVIVCLRSYRMADPNYPGGRPVDYETRERETNAAMEIIGCPWTQWDMPDTEPLWDAIKTWLSSYMSEDSLWKPTKVFAPAVIAGHDQHDAIGRIAKDVFGDIVVPYLSYTAAGKATWGTEVEFEPEWVAIKHRVLACYESQCAHPATRSHFLGDMREYVA